MRSSRVPGHGLVGLYDFLGHGPYLPSNRFSLSAIGNRTHRTGYAPTTSQLRKNPGAIGKFTAATKFSQAKHLSATDTDANTACDDHTFTHAKTRHPAAKRSGQ
jgi:hypothetical protein